MEAGEEGFVLPPALGESECETYESGLCDCWWWCCCWLWLPPWLPWCSGNEC